MTGYAKVTTEINDGVTSTTHSITWFEEDGEKLPTVEEVMATLIKDHCCERELIKHLGI